MVKQINKRFSPPLSQIARPCIPNSHKLIESVTSTNIWPEDLVQHIQDLKDTAESMKHRCAGLASNQIWDDKTTTPYRVFVAKIMHIETKEVIWMEFINPEIKMSGAKIKHEEGCLSRDHYKRKVRRHMNVSITWQTLNSEEIHTNKFYGNATTLAFVCSHEVDHLNGVTIWTK